jgi:hypothetical protein
MPAGFNTRKQCCLQADDLGVINIANKYEPGSRPAM